MNYPIEQLAVIGPVLFIILMIGLPIIGVFAGWKRALYWGGGNFLFYIIGMLIWTFAGEAICGKFTPLFESLISGTGIKVETLTGVATGVIAPVFFIIILIVGNLLLLINYFAWFRRVAGLKKKKQPKQVEGQKQVQANVAVKKKGVTQSKPFNMIVGGVAMTALMLPTTFAFSEAVMMGTTSASTRKNSSLAKGTYEFFLKTNKAFNWMSYYKTSLRDMDALFATISLLNSNVTIDGEEMTVIEGVETVFSDGFNDIYQATTSGGGVAEIKTSVDEMAKKWNQIMDQKGEDVGAVFNSENATDIIQQVINKEDGGTQKVTSADMDAYKDGGIFDQAVQEYLAGGMTQFKQVDVDQACYDNMKKTLMNQFDISALSESEKKTFEARMDQMLGVMFK